MSQVSPIVQTPQALQSRQELLRSIDFPDEVPFKIKAYSKKELADCYGVHLNTIGRWIDRHLPAFKKIGYHKRLKKLDPCMVRLFVEIFSEP